MNSFQVKFVISDNLLMTMLGLVVITYINRFRLNRTVQPKDTLSALNSKFTSKANFTPNHYMANTVMVIRIYYIKISEPGIRTFEFSRL